jgi:hypothetical protein
MRANIDTNYWNQRPKSKQMENIKPKKLEEILTDKDYKDENGFWVVVHDFETWQKMGNRAIKSVCPVLAHVDMDKTGWTPRAGEMYPAREHWVTTTEPYYLVTPETELQKIEQEQQRIYWEIVNELLEWYKKEFLEGLENTSDKKRFWESKLKDWSNEEFSREVIQDEWHFWQVVPRWIDEAYPTKKQDRGNSQAKEVGRYQFLLWLEKYQLLDNTPPPVATSTEAKEPKKKQKKALDELAKLLEPNVVVQWAIEQAAIKAGYSSDNVWKLYRKVKNGELSHKQLTVIMTSKSESD